MKNETEVFVMKDKTYHAYLDSHERQLVIHSLVELKNRLIQEGRYTDCVDELIFKVVNAPVKKMKIEHIWSSIKRSPQRTKSSIRRLWQRKANDTQQPEIKTVEDFLDSIENQQLYQILIKVDKLTLQIALLKIQGYSTREIAHSLNITEKAVYRRMDRLKEKLKKFFE